MDRFELVIAGYPVAQERPRFSTARGYVRAYDPARSRDWKLVVGQMAREKMEGENPMEGPLSLDLTVEKTPPTSWSKKRTEHAVRNGVGIDVKPDLDNYIKIALDAISGVVFVDDRQVVMITARKRYSRVNSMRIEITEVVYEA